MKAIPTIGRIVIVRMAPGFNNGSTEAPAMVSRVFGESEDGSWTVNVRVFADSGDVPWQTSVKLWPTEADVPEGAVRAAWWPPRI